MTDIFGFNTMPSFFEGLDALASQYKLESRSIPSGKQYMFPYGPVFCVWWTGTWLIQGRNIPPMPEQALRGHAKGWEEPFKMLGEMIPLMEPVRGMEADLSKIESAVLSGDTHVVLKILQEYYDRGRAHALRHLTPSSTNSVGDASIEE